MDRASETTIFETAHAETIGDYALDTFTRWQPQWVVVSVPSSSDWSRYMRFWCWWFRIQYSAPARILNRVGSLTKSTAAFSVFGSIAVGLGIMVQIDEFIVADACWVVSAFIFSCKCIHWAGLNGQRALSGFLRAGGVILACLFVAAFMFWTSLKKGTKPWSAFSVLLERSGSLSARSFPISLPSYALQRPYSNYP
jgi:hypothetical protein